MRSDATFQMVAIAKRIADKNGVSVSDVLDKFSRGVKKNAHTRSDFFWGDSDISLGGKKNFQRVRRSGVADRRRKVARISKGVKR